MTRRWIAPLAALALATPAMAEPQHHAHRRVVADDPVAAVVPPSAEVEHVVKPGETLGGIATRAEVPRVLIIEANNLKPPYAVRAGQRLALPRTRHHVVQPGETGFDIAYRYGVPYDSIAVANAMQPDDPLRVGQKLLIPSVLSAKTPPPAKPKPGAADDEGDEINRAVHGASTDHAGTAAPKFAWPIAGKVLRPYAARDTANYHDGIDIAAPAGAPVRASAGGEVIFAGKEPESFGNLVVIDHRNGWQTAYGFLQKLTVAKGDTVRANERIGLAGHSGRAKGDELHFEIREANQPVDPAPKLPTTTTAADQPHDAIGAAVKAPRPKPKKAHTPAPDAD